MSAEILRRAAALMRERAEAAPSGEGWYVDAGDVWVMHDPDGDSASRLVESFPIWADGADKHIASWHPAVALAVADWLETEASEWERFVVKAQAVNVLLRLADNESEIEAQIGIGYHTQKQAIAVARAYLGESA